MPTLPPCFVLDRDALRARLALGNLTREELLVAVAALLDAEDKRDAEAVEPADNQYPLFD